MSLTKILVIDDSEADQFLASLAISEFQPTAELLTARDGKEALELLQSLPEPPQLILLDINMPVMNGYEFLQHYETLSDAQAVVVMLTSSDQETDRSLPDKFECVKRYLIKPVDLQDLRLLDRELLS